MNAFEIRAAKCSRKQHTHSIWVAAQAGVEGLMRALVDQAEFVASQTADDEMFTRFDVEG